jgi:hypothetical protein
MRRFGLGILAALALSPITAKAADQSNGCGLGWYVTSRMSLSATTTRGTTNYFLPNTFSMTSGTSGCAAHSLVMRDKQGLHFLEADFDQVQADAARGGGEHLGALAQAVGCDSAAYDTFRHTMQANYDKIYDGAGDNAGAVVGRVHDLINASPELARNCNRT